MDDRLKITGIYDRKTLKMISSLGITAVGFDFRPKSFNFLQEYVLLEMIEACYSPKSLYFLEFQNEADFVVDKLLADIKETVARLGHSAEKNFILEFSDEQELNYYESFGLPFIWHFKNLESLNKIMNSSKLRGIIIDYSFISELNKKEELVSFANQINKIYKGVPLILKIDWDSDIFPSLVEYFSFAHFSLAINSKTELSYRNVDAVAVKRHLQQYF